MSGKTALGRYLFLHLSENPSTPVLHIDLDEIYGSSPEKILRNTYQQQFHGDYNLWKNKADKILILDNLTNKAKHLDFLDFTKNVFDKIIVTCSSDKFNAFFRDEERLADFYQAEICILTHHQQEQLIRKRAQLLSREHPLTDGDIDQIEKRINSVIISNKIVPRYPFFVLSILQTYEAFMPDDLSITSYGHCYKVLIIAHLIKSGVSSKDSDINACFNFAERLAFATYESDGFNYDKFVADYKTKFHIQDSLLNRMKNSDYGIINQDGRFRATYLLLGKLYT